MKYLVFILFLCACLLGISCEKEKSDSTKLEGKWKLTGYYISSGASGEWKPADKSKNEYIEFKNNGDLKETVFGGKYTRYTVKDSITLELKEPNDSIQNFLYVLKDGNLTLSPSGPIICIEGCASRFSKVDE